MTSVSIEERRAKVVEVLNKARCMEPAKIAGTSSSMGIGFSGFVVSEGA
jgi:hypothetical protein